MIRYDRGLKGECFGGLKGEWIGWEKGELEGGGRICYDVG